jgi:GNAT superfamily N-acetyltransferase
MNIQVFRFDASRRADFFRLHSDENGCGWCYCVAWWVPTWQGWGERTAAENRILRDALCDSGEYDGYLLYVDGVPAAWCQVGPRDRLEKLARQFQLAPDPAAWAITCFLVAPRYRRTGLAARLLQEVLEDLHRQNVRSVEAFPRRGDKLDEDDLWNGPEAMFLNAGFIVVRQDPTRPILALQF